MWLQQTYRPAPRWQNSSTSSGGYRQQDAEHTRMRRMPSQLRLPMATCGRHAIHTPGIDTTLGTPLKKLT